MIQTDKHTGDIRADGGTQTENIKGISEEMEGLEDISDWME